MRSAHARWRGADVARGAVVVQRQPRQPRVHRGLGHEGGAAGVLSQQRLLRPVERVVQQRQQLQAQVGQGPGICSAV